MLSFLVIIYLQVIVLSQLVAAFIFLIICVGLTAKFWITLLLIEYFIDLSIAKSSHALDRSEETEA